MLFFFFLTLQAYLIGISASICISRESWCLPYAGFFLTLLSLCQKECLAIQTFFFKTCKSSLTLSQKHEKILAVRVPGFENMSYMTWIMVRKRDRGNATEHVWYFKCQRKYYNGSASENTDLNIFCDTCL